MEIYLLYQSEWLATGSGYDNVIGALWVNPSTCQPVGSTIAHEIGHSFQYMVFCDYLLQKGVPEQNRPSARPAMPVGATASYRTTATAAPPTATSSPPPREQPPSTSPRIRRNCGLWSAEPHAPTSAMPGPPKRAWPTRTPTTTAGPGKPSSQAPPHRENEKQVLKTIHQAYEKVESMAAAPAVGHRRPSGRCRYHRQTNLYSQGTARQRFQ